MTSVADRPNPSTTSPERQPSATEEQVSHAVLRLRTAFATGRSRELQWRLDKLAALEKLLDEREPEIAQALAADLGRSRDEAWLGDIGGTKTEARYARKHLRSWMRRRRTGLPVSMLPGRAFYQYEALGVVLIIGPWN